MATTPELERLYLAYFGRPPDAAGSAFYANLSVAQIEAAFAASPEAKASYGSSSGKPDAAMVTAFYQHLFNRTPSQAEVQYWADQAAASALSPAGLAAAMAGSATGSDGAALTNRLSYVHQWADSFNSKAATQQVDATAAAALAMRQLATVGADTASLTAATAATNSALGPSPVSLLQLKASLYLAFFGRPVDASGDFYANLSIAQIEAAFDGTNDAQKLYASNGGKFSLALATAAYQNLFHRTPSQAEVQYWVDLASTQGLSPSAAVVAMLLAAREGDAASALNRLAYVQQWSDTFRAKAAAINLDLAAATALAMKELASIGADPASLAAASNETNIALTPAPAPSPAPAVNLVLTTATTDVVYGTSGDDTINAITGTGATLNTGDTINGAGGIDTLAIVNSNSPGIALSDSPVTNVEKLQVQTTGAAFSVITTGTTGLTDVINNGSTQNLSFLGLGNVVNVSVLNTTKSTTASFASGALTGNSDTLSLTLQNATGAAPVVLKSAAGGTNQLETLNISSSGTANSITLGTDTAQTSLATINISGAAPLVLAFSGTTDHITTSAVTIDASTATGGLTLGSFDVPLGTANHNIKLGTGANIVYFGSNLDGNDTLNASLGTSDVLAVTQGAASADFAHVTGVETMRFSNSAGLLTQDVTQLPGSVTTLQVEGSNTVVSFTNLANNAAVDVLSGFQLRMALATDTGADALTLRLAPGTTAGTTLTTMNNVTGLETLNIVSNGASGQTAANVIGTDNVTAAQVLTGSANLVISNALKTSSFDASAFTGNLTAIGQASTATTLKGGSGNDSLTLGSGADTVDAGAGNDTIYLAPLGTNIHLGRGADTITTGTGNDTIVFIDNTASGNGGSSNYTSVATVTDFTVGSTLSATDFLAFSGDNSTYFLSTNTGLARGTTAQGLAQGDTMVLQSLASTDGAVAASTNVSFIKLTTGVAFTTNIATTFANALSTSSITGLAASGNYVVSLYDTGASKAVIAIVNVAGDGILSSADFTSTGVAVVGTLSMSAGDYASFGAINLATVM